MSQNDHHDSADDFAELERLMREMLSGAGMPGGDAGTGSGLDPSELAKAAGLPADPQALQGLFATLRGAMQDPGDGIDWSVTRKTAIEVASRAGDEADPAQVLRAFPVAALWLDEVTELGATPDAPRSLTRIEWVQRSVETWISLSEPVAESISRALMEALQSQLPEEMAEAFQGAAPMLRSVGSALFAVQLGTVIGQLSSEVVSAGDIGIPLLSGQGYEGGALLPSGVANFAEGLEQDAEAVSLYLALRELAHARLFRHSKWLRLGMLSAISDYARGMRIDTERIEELAREIDPAHPEHIQALLSNGSLIPPKTEAQVAAHARLETMLALIEGWVDVVTADAAQRIPGAEAIAEMVRRRRATGGPSEHALSALVGLELRPRKLREAAALWRLLGERSSTAVRDGLWAHPDVLPTAEEIDHPELLLARLGIIEGEPTEADQEFDAALAQLLNGDLPPHTAGDGGAQDQPDAPRDGAE